MKSLDVSELLAVPKLTTYISQVEQELGVILATANPHIRQPLKRLIKAHSKRLRPVFIIAVAASQGAKIDKTIIRSCVPVELAHIGSLVHDDIMDEATTRWRVPTINSQEGVDQAILIGDYLFAKAFEQAAKVSQELAGLIGLSLAALCDGQSREMADQHNLDRTIDSLQKAHYGKTGALFEVACQIGGISAGLPPFQVKALANYGKNFGMAFQLIDDVLDLLSTEELSGKPVGNDVTEGIYTLPVLLSLKGPSGKSLRALLSSHKKIDNSLLIDRLLRDGSLKKTIQKIQKYNQAAAAELSKFTATAALTDLKNLPETYLSLALGHYVAPAYRSAVTDLLA